MVTLTSYHLKQNTVPLFSTHKQAAVTIVKSFLSTDLEKIFFCKSRWLVSLGAFNWKTPGQQQGKSPSHPPLLHQSQKQQSDSRRFNFKNPGSLLTAPNSMLL